MNPINGKIKNMTETIQPAAKQRKRYSFSYQEKWIPFILLIFTVFTYVPLIHTLGFYWDDWPMLWFDVTQGPQGFADAFTSDRPFLGYLYQLTGAVIGTEPLYWQILTVVFRWLVSCAFWWMLKLLWPEHKETSFWAAVLLTVYSGFKQMPIAYVWGNALIMLFAYVLSYGMMLKAITSAEKADWKRYAAWTIPGVICYTFCTISTEYYTGLDLIRIVMIWIFLDQMDSFRKMTFQKKIIKSLLHWVPYLVPLAIFMFWRVFIFQFPSYQPVLISQLQTEPVKAVLGVLIRAIGDAYTAFWGAWTEFFSFPKAADFATISGKLFWIFVAAGFVVSILTLSGLRLSNGLQQKEEPDRKKRQARWIISLFVLGTAAVIFPGVPYWVTSLSPSLEFPKERWLSAYMFGSSILMAGFITHFIRTRKQQIIVVSLFIAMAIGGNILNANSFRRDWQSQREFINQLYTRIPGFQAPMYLLTDFNSLSYETDNSLTGMVNLALASESSSLDLPLSVGFYDVRFKSSNEKLEAGEPIYQGFRSANFSGSVSDVVAYFYSPPGCLRILDPKQHEDLPIFPDSFYEFIKYSNPSNILSSGNAIPFVQEKIFKKPIEKNWCYYFELADLARQNEDWEKIAALGDQSIPYFSAGDASEYILFIEAYAHNNQWEKVIPLIDLIHQKDQKLDAPLCPILQRLFTENLPDNSSMRNNAAVAINKIGCNAYTQ